MLTSMKSKMETHITKQPRRKLSSKNKLGKPISNSQRIIKKLKIRFIIYSYKILTIIIEIKSRSDN